jgi:hypothetical protein
MCVSIYENRGQEEVISMPAKKKAKKSAKKSSKKK